MARTFGGASTDSITTALTTHATTRSYSIWTYRTGTGGGNLGRMFDKRTSGAQVELLFHGSADTDYFYDRNWSGAAASWKIAIPSANAWHNIIVTYDTGATTNDPVIYVDGASVTVTENVAPSGTANTNTDAYVIGNRTNDNARNWAGDLCEFAVWDRILTATEVDAIGADGYSPLFYPSSLVEYVPLIRDISSRKLAAPTSSGTVVQVHPRIIYPSSGM